MQSGKGKGEAGRHDLFKGAQWTLHCTCRGRIAVGGWPQQGMVFRPGAQRLGFEQAEEMQTRLPGDVAPNTGKGRCPGGKFSFG